MNAAVIAVFANFILGSGLFEKIKEAVVDQENSLLSGSQKKAGVIGQLEAIGIATGSSLINLGIELAVAWVGAKAGKTGK